MKFTQFHNAFFNSQIGACSKVTDREYYDSQITLTDLEAKIVTDYFGINNLLVGGVGTNSRKAIKKFLLFPTLNEVYLNLIYPKPGKPELRLYLSSQKGFKPKAGEVWFLFLDHYDSLVLGAMEEKLWNSLGQQDIIDEDYQEEIEDVILGNPIILDPPVGGKQKYKSKGREVYKRDPRIAVLRFITSNYT
jgi:5-methylcytosine-specific restriction enzyme A